MAGAGWHLAVTGGGGLQTSGTGGDGTVGAGVVKGSDGGQHAGRSDGARAAAICHLLPLVTASRLLLSQYRPSPLIGSPLSPPVTTRLSPPPVDYVTTHMAPPITASAWTVIGELHTYRWSSVLLTAHRLASRLALEAFESLHGQDKCELQKFAKFCTQSSANFNFWMEFCGRRFVEEDFGDKEMGMKFCGQVFEDKDLQTKLCG